MPLLVREQCFLRSEILLPSRLVFVGVQSLIGGRVFVTPWTAARQAPLSFTISRNLRKFTSMKSVMPSNHLILRDPLLLLPSVSPSIRVFPVSWLFASGGQSIGSSASALVLPGLISFRMDCFDLLAVQGASFFRVRDCNFSSVKGYI